MIKSNNKQKEEAQKKTPKNSKHSSQTKVKSYTMIEWIEKEKGS